MPFKKELSHRLIYFVAGLSIIAAIAATSYKEYASFGRNNRQFRYYVNTFNYIYAVGRYYKKTLDAKRQFTIIDSAPTIMPKTTTKPRVLVLVVGETARAQNFSLYGYEKETNPLLSKFRRSFLSAINKLYPEEVKKYESSYVFHQNKIMELSKKAKLQLVTFDGQEYNEGLPVTPLNADEFSSVDNLVVFQTIEPTIVTNNGDIVHQGTIILAEKE